MLTRTVDMTSGKYQKPHFGREDLIKEAEKRTGIPRKEFIAMGTTETGEIATKEWTTRDKNGKEVQHKIRAVAVKVWVKVPRLDKPIDEIKSDDRSTNLKDHYVNVKNQNGDKIEGKYEYDTKILTNPRTGQPYIRWQIINERHGQYVKPNKKTSTFQ